MRNTGLIVSYKGMKNIGEKFHHISSRKRLYIAFYFAEFVLYLALFISILSIFKKIFPSII